MKISFEPWGELPPSKTLDNALKNASSAKLTPLFPVDLENKTATFSGDHGLYTTTLTSCVSENGVMCGGLASSMQKGLPCKHILRLAMELGLIDCEFKTDPLRIKLPKNSDETLGYDPLVSAVAALEEYPDLMRDISFIISSYGLENKFLFRDIRPFQFFIDNDLLSVSHDLSGVEMPLRQKDCIDALEALSYEFPADLKLRRDKYAYACEHAADILPILFPNCAVLLPGKNMQGCLHSLSQYIDYRLRDTTEEDFWNDEGEWECITVPRSIAHLSKKVQALLCQYDEVYKDAVNQPQKVEELLLTLRVVPPSDGESR